MSGFGKLHRVHKRDCKENANNNFYQFFLIANLEVVGIYLNFAPNFGKLSKITTQVCLPKFVIEFQ
jgi:hypothetical protein